MKKLTILTALMAWCFSLSAETWFHFQNESDYFVSYYKLKRMGYTPKNQFSSPLRLSISETLDAAAIAKIKEQDPSIIDINYDSLAIISADHYSPWGVVEKERKFYTKVVWGGATAVTFIHGVSAWRWLNERVRFAFGNERWFSKESYSGGADKTGHMFSYYFQKRALNWFFVKIGHDLDSANLQSALLAEALGVLVEVGDGMTHYHFSYEDVIMNTVGVIAAYYADKYPWLDEFVSFKWQYWPSHDLIHGDDLGKSNITSDYSGQTFWMSFKAAGIRPLNHTAWRYLSLDLGYYTRGFIPNIENTKWSNPYRALTIGVGLNLSELFFKYTPSNNTTISTTRLLKYWAPPQSVQPLATYKMD